MVYLLFTTLVAYSTELNQIEKFIRICESNWTEFFLVNWTALRLCEWVSVYDQHENC